jgi:CRP/FNR family transcriptional activator FtrB
MTRLSVDRVRETSLFAGLPEELWSECARQTRVFNFPKHSTLYEQFSAPEQLFVLLQGAIELTSREEGGLSTEMISAPHAAFPLSDVLTGKEVLTSAKTSRASDLAIIPAAFVRHCADTSHRFCCAALQMSVAINRRRFKKINALKLRNTTERLALWLLENRAEDGSVEVPFELRSLAALLGTTPENLSRSFGVLSEALAKRGFKQFQIVDEALLQRAARPSRLVLVR